MFKRFAVLALSALLPVAVTATELSDAVQEDYDTYLWPLFDHFHRNPELSLVENCDVTLVVSEAEKRLLAEEYVSGEAASRIEVLSNCGSGGLREYVHFNIGYEVPAERVETLLKETWRRACESENAINPDMEPRIFLVDNGDHAITWRLMYVVRNVYRITMARFVVQRAAHDVSSAEGIGLNTPLTHSLLEGAPAGPAHSTDDSP